MTNREPGSLFFKDTSIPFGCPKVSAGIVPLAASAALRCEVNPGIKRNSFVRWGGGDGLGVGCCPAISYAYKAVLSWLSICCKNNSLPAITGPLVILNPDVCWLKSCEP